ncbi:unnamed protein product, partial [Amoebophrya sp. A120]
VLDGRGQQQITSPPPPPPAGQPHALSTTPTSVILFSPSHYAAKVFEPFFLRSVLWQNVSVSPAEKTMRRFWIGAPHPQEESATGAGVPAAPGLAAASNDPVVLTGKLNLVYITVRTWLSQYGLLRFFQQNN